ncbi:type I-B CRISPR-associated protein Cas5b [Paludifilum halophilum]|uniref:Type I-B CRISPR-associated protein Cas5 n=1 Tax=Paludifilum halophilum TaxID=1642702 RepID=A0A235B1P5_9BACL|nr:type I-B CRISPR-associated protein Cas5b [Paludifilum halophilum]OYD06228.1 type I-B CRISPR-associated protein Cas5 [Paludifilum halophilum]
MRTLIFDLWGEWGHFRKYYSTSSPLTFSVIPPTAVFGVVGAILGLEKEGDQYLKILRQADTLVGVGLRKPVKKSTLGLNLINTKGNVWVPKRRKEGARTQIRTEFLREPGFRLFVSMKDPDLYGELVERVQGHRPFYTLSLGLSELLANFVYVGEADVFKGSAAGEPVEMDSIIPMGLIRQKGIPFTEGKRYKKERMPLAIDDNRVVTSYAECLFETQGSGIQAEVDHFWEGEGTRFVFLNEKEWTDG